tara:strand:- start:247 stop:1422 length:1176 start_codon:yes stop_codon:yes gene_type:complete
MIIGLVGKPSVGKSCFFRASTLAEVEINARPFTTLKSTEGEGYVNIKCAEKEFDVKCDPRYGFCLKGERFVPIRLLDVPGLVEGAYEGKGMGNQFLDELNEADALIHVIDISGSTDKEGNLVEPLSYDPEKDIKFLENELDQWYLRILKKGWEKFARTVRQENLDIKKALAKQLSGLRVTEDIANDAIKKLNLVHSPSDWTEDDLFNLASELRKITKPMIIVANKVDVEGARMNYERLKEKYDIIPCSAEIELALREAAKHNLINYIPGDNKFELLEGVSGEKKKALDYMKKFLDEFESTGVQEVLNKIVFEILKYIAVFPGGVNKLEDSKGNVLPDCFLMEKDSTALDFAYKLHKDLGDGFIRAITVKDKRTVGKEYLLKNRDVIEIVSK